ncbi:MAG: 6-pyruvoyl-tetrahydropterin synthase-related protein, partial [Syntrophomonadaceae bacterium]|nr:6-pyruvoyl-tetrahydropterin synthase-related protein [Syntrophomonadaceae bacterium]
MADGKENLFNQAAAGGDSSGNNGLRPEKFDSAYTTKLISFFNARHFVTFGSTTGPVHGHTWQFHIDIRVPKDQAEQVAFHRVMELIKSVLAPYEDKLLNRFFPFNQIQPTTENIAMFFFNRIEDVLRENDLHLGCLTVWETPTRGVEVVSRCQAFDELVEDGGKAEAGEAELIVGTVIEPALEEAAAAALLEAAAREETVGEAAAGEKQEAVREKPDRPASRAAHPGYSLSQYAVGFCMILLAAVLAYYRVLLPPFEQHYPWGSDTWGHLFKAEFLYNEILKGNYYPQFTEYWYNGSQPFRYWAPLPYYLLALLRTFSSDIFIAGNYYVFLCALLGGLSWLFFARRMGIWPAVLAGLVWLVWQDNVRVTFSEGNLPRVLATALLPLLFILCLRVLENRRAWGSMVGLAALVHLAVLCHAMIGAIYCLCLALFTLLFWIFRGCQLRDCWRGVFVILSGVATSAWWLLPSLTGGITQIDAQAVKEAIQFVPALVSLNPLHRFANCEAFYWGIGLIAALGVTGLTWKSKPPWAKALAVCGLILVLVTFPTFRVLYVTLPYTHLMWPLRFSSFAALALLASAFAFNPPEMRQRQLRSAFAVGVLILALFAAIFADSWASLNLLAFTGTKSFGVVQSGEYLKEYPGWRVATIDLSRLGSAPSYIFSETMGMEQVFGWAWQGAVTSNNIMLLNTGLEMQRYPFLFRSCVNLGATELVVKDDVVNDREDFAAAAALAGYRPRVRFSGISIWHGYDRPYLV